jgi:anaerobic ribonucleoside-triphosphate reductase activating protein
MSTSLPMLNVAATCRATRALGPGLRAAVWVQGCPLRCRGCLAPDWIPFRPARALSPAELAAELLAEPGVSGLTFSGGEPMAQAAGLARAARLARRERPLSLICFTGFRLERLRSRPPSPGVDDLLDEVDVLIDGPYLPELNDGRGLRGSANQRVHFLTGRLREVGYDFAGRPRQAEVRLGVGETFLVGVPPPGLTAALAGAEPSTTAGGDDER